MYMESPSKIRSSGKLGMPRILQFLELSAGLIHTFPHIHALKLSFHQDISLTGIGTLGVTAITPLYWLQGAMFGNKNQMIMLLRPEGAPKRIVCIEANPLFRDTWNELSFAQP